jgi:hypothetical protein
MSAESQATRRDLLELNFVKYRSENLFPPRPVFGEKGSGGEGPVSLANSAPSPRPSPPLSRRRGRTTCNSQILYRCRVSRNVRSAFTLIEALIAVTMTLVIMLALAQGFKQVSNDISEGRARLNLSDQLRGVSELLRNDLAGITVVCDPQSKETKNGYFMYYEGPLADHHPVTCPVNNVLGGKTEENLSASRFGDFDDILMFTAKAKGDWFKGRVPLALVKGATMAGGGTYTGYMDADWQRTVVVASEYAEIAWFMMPKLQPTASGGTNPDFIYQTNANLTPPIVDNTVPVNPGATVPPFAAGAFQGGVGDGIPDQMSLCRRVLLILPQLNRPVGTLFNEPLAGVPTANERLQAARLSVSGAEHLVLRAAYQRCDLSVRRAQGSVNATQPIIANSLDDLANPMNRFAHIVLPGATVGAGGNDTSMPILSLTGPIAIQQLAVNGNLSFAARTDGNFPEVGFLNPQFMKRRFDSAGAVEVADDEELGGTVEVLTNEEVVANNCIAFDLKGFDSAARMLFHVGADGLPGVASVDDDNNGTADDRAELGFAGSDDVEVSPSDPGYGETIYSIGATPPAATLADYTARFGSFVDIGWPMKRWQASIAARQVDVTKIPVGIRETALSGLLKGTTNYGEGLLKSGRVVATTLSTPQIFQPCFDSYTSAFERDGFQQKDVGSSNGTIFQDGLDWLQRNPSPSPATADLASNGIDDDANGLVDDFAEQDSSPPILNAMPAVQALIRVEDVNAGVIQQIAVTHDLATQ